MKARWILLISTAFGFGLWAVPSLLDWHLAERSSN